MQQLAARTTELQNAQVLLLNETARSKQLESLLHTSEIRLASAALVANFGYYETPGGRQIAYLDDRVLAMTGIPPDQKHRAYDFWLEHVHPDDGKRLFTLGQEVETGGRDRASAEYRYSHPQRGTIWLHHWVNSLERDVNGKASHIIGVLMDITERKQAESELHNLRVDLMHAARVATIGELSATLAHQLNQPLAAILSNAEAAIVSFERQSGDTNELGRILRDIASDADRAGEVIRRLRALLTKESRQRAPCDVNLLVQESLRIFESDLIFRNVSIETHFDPELPVVLGDAIQLQQVLLNLILNAAAAMSDPPSDNRVLSITTQKIAPDSVQVSIRDTGSGIPPSVMNRMFEEFFTTKIHGTGIGLFVARKIVLNHGGTIWAENNPAHGATFAFTLPLDSPNGGKKS